MKTKIKFVALVVVVMMTLLTENTFALGSRRNRDNHNSHFRPRPVQMTHRNQPISRVIEKNTFTIWITNNNGSQTEVILTVSGTGFLGPRGEYYQTLPTAEQLKPLYGIYSPPPVRNNIIIYLGKVNGVEKVVVLTREGTEYIGPRGERYPQMPTTQQLKLVYVTSSTVNTYAFVTR